MSSSGPPDPHPDNSNHTPAAREHWGSRIGVIFAVMGSAIGLGNFLRFPGLAAKYGGGHFMIPYLVAFLLLGLPIAWSEWSLGRMGGARGFNSSPGILRALWPSNRASPYMGVLGLLIPVGIYMYYVYVESWCLYYAWLYLADIYSWIFPNAQEYIQTMPSGRDPTEFTALFFDYAGMNEHGSLFFGGFKPAVWFLLACFVLNFVIIYRGLSRGIEYVSKIAIPVLFLCAIGVLIRVLTLGTPDPAYPDRDVIGGLGFMWDPELPLLGITETAEGMALTGSLSNPEIWLAAAGQIFFSLSVGFGIIITYSSYVKRNEDIVLSGTTSAAGNVFAEVALGGMITIPAAFIFLGPGFVDKGFFHPDLEGTATFALGFMALPNVFANMPLGSIAGLVFFSLLFVAAITSSLSMLQPAVAFFEEGLGMGRRAAVSILGFICFIGAGFVVYFSAGLKALDLMDFWIGNVLIYILATIIIVYFAWGVGLDRGLTEAHRGALIRIPRIFRFIMKYVAPVYLIVIFILWMIDKMPEYWETMQKDDAARFTVFLIVAIIVLFTLLVAAAVRRWRRLESEGKDPATGGELP